LVVALALLYLLLLMPAPELPVPVGANQAPFAWNRDAFWSSLEIQFKEARSVGCKALLERKMARKGTRKSGPGLEMASGTQSSSRRSHEDFVPQSVSTERL
jgi:hypothetical protein